jgi:hypothetical protein
MANVLQIVDQKGPIPADIQFVAPADGDVILFVAGSAWRRSAGFAGFTVLLDGNPIGQTQKYFNESNSHQALPPTIIPVSLTGGPHTIHLSQVNGETETDANDSFFISMVY